MDPLSSPAHAQQVPTETSSSHADFPAELAQLIKQEAGTRLADHGGFFLDYFTDDARMEFPFDPGGGFTVQGQKAIRELFVKVDRSIKIEHVVLSHTYNTEHGDSMILEYTSKPRFLRGDLIFSQQYIAVIRFKEGKIDLFREYINPLKPLQALGKYPVPAPQP